MFLVLVTPVTQPFPIGMKMEYQPKIKKIISQVLDEINKTNPEIPDGSKRKIELILKN